MEQVQDLTRRDLIKTVTIAATVVAGSAGLATPARADAKGDASALAAVTNFDYAILLCTKMKESRTFYRDVLEFPIELDLEQWVSFRVGSGILTLRPRGAWIAWDDGAAKAGSAAVQLAFRVPPPAVDKCYEELVKKGVTIVRAPTDLPEWRHRTLFFRDPEDNVVEIYAEY